MSPKGDKRHGAHRRGKGADEETAARIREAHEDAPDEVNVVVAETDAKNAFLDRRDRS